MLLFSDTGFVVFMVMTDKKAQELIVRDKVMTFLSRELSVGKTNITPSTRLRQDLGLDGEDAEYLLEAFSLHFDVNIDSFRFNDYFGPEAGGNPVLSFVLWIFGNSKPLKTLRVNDLINATATKKL